MTKSQHEHRVLSTDHETGAAVTCLEVAENGIAVLAMDNGSIWTFDSESGMPGCKLGAHTSAVWSLACHDDNIISGSVDGIIKLWTHRNR
jgi:WD40 repeat protein